MATIEIKVPVLAESVAEANLLNWHKTVGDRVERGDNLIDIETDKVTLEVAAPMAGVLKEIIKQDGDDVRSDELIALIDTTPGADDGGVAEAPAAKPITAKAPEQQTLLDMSEAPTEGIKLSPAVRKMLAEHGLQEHDIKVPQHTDRITKQDVLMHLAASEKKDEGSGQRGDIEPPPLADGGDDAPVVTAAAAPAGGGARVAKGDERVADGGDQTPSPTGGRAHRMEDRVPMTRLRKRAAERLLSAQHDNALLTTFNEVDMQAVINLRQRYKQKFEETHGIKLGFMSFFTKAAVEALKQFPIVNAAVDGENIVYRGYFDIGIAVSSTRGLVVPILRDADLLSFAAIETKIAKFGRDANSGKLAIDDLIGGTFTITNGGVFGSLLSTPIVNPPQSAILGMHAINQRPVAEHGEVVIRPMMYLALSYDHRIIDGREAVQFLVSIKTQIEDPARLLLQV